MDAIGARDIITPYYLNGPHPFTSLKYFNGYFCSTIDVRRKVYRQIESCMARISVDHRESCEQIQLEICGVDTRYVVAAMYGCEEQ